MFFKSCSILSQIQRSDLRKVTKNWDRSCNKVSKELLFGSGKKNKSMVKSFKCHANNMNLASSQRLRIQWSSPESHKLFFSKCGLDKSNVKEIVTNFVSIFPQNFWTKKRLARVRFSWHLKKHLIQISVKSATEGLLGTSCILRSTQLTSGMRASTKV